MLKKHGHQYGITRDYLPTSQGQPA